MFQSVISLFSNSLLGSACIQLYMAHCGVLIKRKKNIYPFVHILSEQIDRREEE